MGNSCSYLVATSFTSPFTQVWDKRPSSDDAGDRKLQLRAQERGEDEPLRADSARNNRKEGGSHLTAELSENPEHLSAQRPGQVWNKTQGQCTSYWVQWNATLSSSKTHDQLQCQVKLLARLRNFGRLPGICYLSQYSNSELQIISSSLEVRTHGRKEYSKSEKLLISFCQNDNPQHLQLWNYLYLQQYLRIQLS